MIEKPATSVAPTSPVSVAPSNDASAREQTLREKAAEFEAVFIGQFLKHAGMEKAFGQEAGHYGQFLLNEISERLAQNGGFGLADQVYEQLKRQDLAANAAQEQGQGRDRA